MNGNLLWSFLRGQFLFRHGHGQDAILERCGAFCFINIIDIERTAHAATIAFTANVISVVVFLILGIFFLGGNGNIVIFVGKIDIIFCQPWKLGLELEALGV